MTQINMAPETAKPDAAPAGTDPALKSPDKPAAAPETKVSPAGTPQK